MEASKARIPDLNLKRWHVLSAVLAVSVLVGGTFAIAATPTGQFASGSIRLASSWSGDSIDITGSDDPESLKRVLRTSISVPSGRTADVQASFSAALHPRKLNGTFAYCFGRFTIDSQSNVDPQFRPGQTQLIGGSHAEQPDAITVTMNGFRKGIGPGTHYVNVYVSSAFEGCQLQERALNVVVNIR